MTTFSGNPGRLALLPDIVKQAKQISMIYETEQSEVTHNKRRLYISPVDVTIRILVFVEMLYYLFKHLANFLGCTHSLWRIMLDERSKTKEQQKPSEARHRRANAVQTHGYLRFAYITAAPRKPIITNGINIGSCLVMQ